MFPWAATARSSSHLPSLMEPPLSHSPFTYGVLPGETLATISAKFKVTESHHVGGTCGRPVGPIRDRWRSLPQA